MCVCKYLCVYKDKHPVSTSAPVSSRTVDGHGEVSVCVCVCVCVCLCMCVCERVYVHMCVSMCVYKDKHHVLASAPVSSRTVDGHGEEPGHGAEP